MCFGSDKIGKIQFFHFLVEIARKLSLLWLRPVWGPKAQYISLLLEQSDQAFVAYRSSNRLIEGPLKWLGWLCHLMHITVIGINIWPNTEKFTSFKSFQSPIFCLRASIYLENHLEILWFNLKILRKQSWSWVQIVKKSRHPSFY